MRNYLTRTIVATLVMGVCGASHATPALAEQTAGIPSDKAIAAACAYHHFACVPRVPCANVDPKTQAELRSVDHKGVIAYITCAQGFPEMYSFDAPQTAAERAAREKEAAPQSAWRANFPAFYANEGSNQSPCRAMEEESSHPQGDPLSNEMEMSLVNEASACVEMIHVFNNIDAANKHIDPDYEKAAHAAEFPTLIELSACAWVHKHSRINYTVLESNGQCPPTPGR